MLKKTSASRLLPATALLCWAWAAAAAAPEEAFVPLFNGRDLTGWVNVNCAPETWTVRDGAICCTGFPTGALRTERQYENFVLEVEWRHLKSGGNSGVFIWGTPISAPGVPFLRGIEVQVLDHGYNAKGKNEWYTTHGDVFPIHGATMKPLGRHNGQRSFPSEERSKPSPEWNHYRIVCTDGSIRLQVNGKEVSGGDDCNYRKGYLALESEGAPVEFRNVRIRELPPTNTPPELTAPLDQGWRPLYTGADLRGWRDAAAAAARWQPRDWTLTQKTAQDAGRAPLWTEAEFGDFEIIVDARQSGKATANATPAGLLLNGGAGKEIAVPFKASDAPLKPGSWARYRVLRKGRTVTVWQNEKELERLDLPEAAPADSALGLIDAGGGIEFANIFVRRL